MARFTSTLSTAALAFAFSACALEHERAVGEAQTESRESDSLEEEVLRLFGPNATIVNDPIDGAETSWFGATHVTINSATQYGGWVDGNGPDRYAAYADCSNGHRAYGPTPWAGDRRGSVASCYPNNISIFKGFILIDL
jgi:hypothetical protein